MGARRLWVLLGGVAGVAICSAVQAANIGIDFVGANNNSGDKLTATMSAGVFPQTSWNVTSASATGSINAYADDGVSTHSVAVNWSAKSVYDISTTTGTAPNSSNGDQILNNGALYTNGTTANSTSVTVANVTSVGSTYTVYAYFITDHQANIGVTLNTTGGSTTYYGSTPATPNATGYIDGTTTSGFTYAQATSTTAGTYTLGADYAAFTVPNTVTTFNITETLFTGSAAGNGALAGIQVVGVVPEPASLSLLAVGTLGLLSRRRRPAFV